MRVLRHLMNEIKILLFCRFRHATFAERHIQFACRKLLYLLYRRLADVGKPTCQVHSFPFERLQSLCFIVRQSVRGLLLAFTKLHVQQYGRTSQIQSQAMKYITHP